MNCEILRHEKKDCRNSPFLVLSFAHSSFITFSYTNTETLYIITETLILSRKLPSCFRDNNRLLPTSIYYQAKELQNKSSYLHKYKNALKNTRK